MTDESVIEWASGWLLECPPGDPTFRARFLDGLLAELKARRVEERELCVKELMKVAAAARAAVAFKVDWTSREAADRWEELNNAVASLDRKFV